MTVLACLTVLEVLESTLNPITCPTEFSFQYQEAAAAVLMVLAALAVATVSVVTATPLKLNPPFSDILNKDIPNELLM